MINPINIKSIETINKDFKPITIVTKVSDIPEYDYSDYDIDNERDYKKYIADLEKEVRGSFEYKEMLKYLRLYMNMGESASFENINNKESTKIRIELHHYPFTLYDICTVVVTKRLYYHENMELQMVAKEAMMLHYQLLIGLISLSQTEHELYHNNYFFIPEDRVLGRYDLFMDYYKEFLLPEMEETIEEIKEHSKTYNMEHKNLLTQVNIQLDASNYKLSDLYNLRDGMVSRIGEIKQNQYMLPTVNKNDINPSILSDEPKVKAFEIIENWKREAFIMS